MPSTPYTENLDVVGLLGTDEVQVGLSFTLNTAGTSKMMDGDRDFVNNELIGPNISDIVDILHDPVNLITEYTVREFLKGLIKDEITIQVDQARKKYNPDGASTTEDIMNEVGMDDTYFDNFTYALYRAADAEGATVDSVTEVLYAQVDDALARAEESGMVDTSGYTEASKAALRDDLLSNLEAMALVNPDGTLNRISQMAFVYLSDYLVDALQGKVDDSELVRKSDEDYYTFSGRLVRLFVYNQIPDNVYTIMGYVALALFIGIIVFATNWILLIVITLFRTLLAKKPWTIFGPWFWFLGSLQIILGFAITYLCKVTLPSMDVSTYLAMFNLPIRAFFVSTRTYALIPSILYMICVPLAFVYGFFKRRCRREMRQEEFDEDEEDEK